MDENLSYEVLKLIFYSAALICVCLAPIEFQLRFTLDETGLKISFHPVERFDIIIKTDFDDLKSSINEPIGFFPSDDLINFSLYNVFGGVLLHFIFLALLYGMFSYSIKYFVAVWFLDRFQFQLQRIICGSNWDRLSIVSFALVTKRFGLSKPVYLPFIAPDCLLAVLIILYVFITITFLNYYNIISFLSTDLLDFSITIILSKWIAFSQDFIPFGFVIDHLSLLMLVVILTISTFVHYYSIDYMSGDPWLLTFMKYLSGFTLAMVVLVLANNLALLFLGWEGVGIFSFLLIGFWYTWTLALKASLKAVIVNWIGDMALLVAAGLLLQYFGTLDFRWLKDLLPYLFEYQITIFSINFFLFDVSIITLIGIFLLIAAIGKSAQFGLHTWLPDAMEGPTPVSALIHAATMVTAGVYLIVWTSVIFEFSEFAWNCTLVIGAFTALFGAFTACFQYDIKWIIAFSTCSQLGYMFLACGLSAYNIAMFHLFTHAFFKALLFLCAGSVIHALGDEQDIWKMGGLWAYLPITHAGLVVGFLSLAGTPYTSGFFSKDTIIEFSLSQRSIPALYGYLCAMLGACATAYYSVWFFYYVVFQEPKLSRRVLSDVAEHGLNILLTLGSLSLITICIAGLTKNPLTAPFSFIFFNDSIFIKNYHFYFSFYESFLHFYVPIHSYFTNYFKFILLFSPVVGVVFGFWFYWEWELILEYYMIYVALYTTYYPIPYTDITRTVFEHIKIVSTQPHGLGYIPLKRVWFSKFFETKGTIDQFYNAYIVQPIIKFSYVVSYKELDRGWLEFFLVKLPTWWCLLIAKLLVQGLATLKLNFMPGLVFSISLLLIILLIFISN